MPSSLTSGGALKLSGSTSPTNGSRLLSVQQTDDADYFAYTIPGGTLAVGDVLEVRGSARQGGSAPDDDFYLKIGGIVMVQKLNPLEDTIIVARGFMLVTDPALQPILLYSGFFTGELVGYGDTTGTGTPFSVGVQHQGHVIDWSVDQEVRWYNTGGNRVNTMLVWHHLSPA